MGRIAYSAGIFLSKGTFLACLLRFGIAKHRQVSGSIEADVASTRAVAERSGTFWRDVWCDGFSLFRKGNAIALVLDLCRYHLRHRARFGSRARQSVDINSNGHRSRVNPRAHFSGTQQICQRTRISEINELGTLFYPAIPADQVQILSGAPTNLVSCEAERKSFLRCG